MVTRRPVCAEATARALRAGHRGGGGAGATRRESVAPRDRAGYGAAVNGYQGGKPAPAPRFRVNITVPEGALTERRKGMLVEEATRLVLEAAGEDPADAAALLRVWVMIGEVRDGNWGGAGRIIRFGDLKRLVETGADARSDIPVAAPAAG